jgi:hypothetical protein
VGENYPAIRPDSPMSKLFIPFPNSHSSILSSQYSFLNPLLSILKIEAHTFGGSCGLNGISFNFRQKCVKHLSHLSHISMHKNRPKSRSIFPVQKRLWTTGTHAGQRPRLLPPINFQDGERLRQPTIPRGLKPVFIPNPALYKLVLTHTNALQRTKQNQREEIPSL